eukprot:COSAG01_NODE_1540_length_9985_cov_7.634855_4_plen_58_part_00
MKSPITPAGWRYLGSRPLIIGGNCSVIIGMLPSIGARMVEAAPAPTYPTYPQFERDN